MHTVHVLTNANNEAYIIVSKRVFTINALQNAAFNGTAHEEKKNPARNRFVRESKDLECQYFDVPTTLETYDQIIAYRDMIIDQYFADGYLVLDEKHYENLDKKADENFAFITANFDIARLIGVWGKEALLRARKTLTTGEFINHFCSV